MDPDVTAGLMVPGDGLDLFEALLARPAWHAHAACRGKGTAAFFAATSDTARRVCAACPVVAECAEAGQDERHGVWGGLSEDDRRKARRNAA